MGNPDITSEVVRKNIIGSILSNENKTRKRSEQRKFDIYRKHLRPYVIERLTDEFDRETVNTMRKVTSINPAKRIVDEQASLYIDEPRRHWTDASVAEGKQLDAIYEASSINPQLRLANRLYKLHGQGALYVVPRLGKITVRALSPKDYDVIPDADDPERAYAYVLNVVDPATERLRDLTYAEKSEMRYDTVNAANTPIADSLDAQALDARYVWWSDDYHFTTDGNGVIIAPDTPSDSDEDQDDSVDVANPIGIMPFVDIANEKNFKFFVEMGSDIIDFVLDLATQLSDLANSAKFQIYSQAVISSIDEPKGISVGPNKIIWLKIDANAEASAKPAFEFVSPSPDLSGALEILTTQLKMFLSSMGLNPGTVTGDSEIEKFTSGVDHLLANLDKFKATREDMDLFKDVERQLLVLLIGWQNALFDVSADDDEALEDVYLTTRLSENPAVDLVYHEPEAVQTDTECLTYCQTAVEAGLMTKLEAVKRIYKVDEDTAKEIVDTLSTEQEQKDQAEELAVAEDLKGRAVVDNQATTAQPPADIKPDPAASQPGGGFGQ